MPKYIPDEDDIYEDEEDDEDFGNGEETEDPDIEELPTPTRDEDTSPNDSN